ncbi:hypothetical protein [uncultured Helicobacter sp.]|uniref:hypothetical protein n=1 Tax=uncultured Helicobacter sp. TaxID=175537 RepID=UPI0025EAFFFE|nr:hypothetical protein [uncultured Helicobacter sp.]
MLRFGGGTDFYLESNATHHERGESKDSRFACNIDFLDSANAESKVTKDDKANLRLKYIFKRVKINRTKCHLLKRCRGGGYIRGRERLRV